MGRETGRGTLGRLGEERNPRETGRGTLGRLGEERNPRPIWGLFFELLDFVLSIHIHLFGLHRQHTGRQTRDPIRRTHPYMHDAHVPARPDQAFQQGIRLT